MKKKLTKILAGMLAVVMVLTSLTVNWGNVMEAEAAGESYESVSEGEVLADVDFTEENIFGLDDRFVAMEDTTDFVYKYWQNGEVGTTAETTNVALNGTVEMDSMKWIVANASWYKESLLVDGDKATTSNAYVTTESVTDFQGEMISVTFANETYYQINKVCFTPQASYGVPEDFTVEIYNGTEWVVVAKEIGYNSASEWTKEIVPIVGNSVRLNITATGFEKGSTTKHTVQLRELEAYGTVCSNAALSGSVSMNSMVWIKNNVAWYDEGLLVDGKKDNGNTYTTTEEYSDQAHTESITVTFADNTYYDINKIVFSARDGSKGIPEDFIVEVGNGTTWTKVADVTGYKTTGDWTSLGFAPVKGNAVRITATKLGSTGSKYGLQLRELEAYGWKSVNAASGGSATIPSFSSIASWAGTYDPNVRLLNGAKSGNNEFGTSKFYNDGAEHKESATVTFADELFYEIEKIVLYPAVKSNGSYGGGFPKDFTISVWTGTDWKQVASKTDYASGTSSLCLDIEPTMCNAVKIDATELDISNDGSSYALHLAELEAFGEPVGLLQTKTTYDASDATTTLLTLKDIKVTNFRATIEMRNFASESTRYGLVFGHEVYDSIAEETIEVQPLYNSVSDAGSLFAGGSAGVQASTAKYVNDNYADYVDASSGSAFNQPSYVRSLYPIKNFSTNVNDFNTLNVEVTAGLMKLWWTGFENAAWTVKLSEAYDGGYISLYSQGAEQGGFKSFKVQELLVRGGTASDFTKEDEATLNEKFVASQGVTDTNATIATEGVSQYWQLNGGTSAEITNAAFHGTVTMNSMAWIVANAAWYDEGILVNGDKASGNTYVTTEEYSDTDEHEEMITISFADNAYYLLNKVTFNPNNGVYGIPKDFTIEIFNGVEWVVVASETGYATTGEWSCDIVPTLGNAVRINVTRLGYAKDNKKYVLQLNEMEAFGIPVTNVALNGTGEIASFSSISSWAGDYNPNDMTNGVKSGSKEFGTSKFYNDGPEHTESAIVTFAGGNYSVIDKVILFPAINGSTYVGGFPVDFTVSVWDGSKWIQVAEKTNYTSGINGLIIDVESIECNAVKVEATKLSLSSDGKNYALQLAEVEAYGTQVGLLTTKEAYAGGNTTQLTWKEKKVENFKAEIELIDFVSGKTSYGLYLGQSDYGVVEEGVIFVTPNSVVKGGIRVSGTGKMDVSTSAYLDPSISSINGFNKNVSGNYVRSAYAISNYSEGTYDNLHTLNVEVIDGILKVWWSGHETEAWTIDISEGYKGGYVSVFSGGNDQGGIKDFTVYEILDRDIKTNVDMNVEVIGEYTVVTVNNNIAEGILKNSTLKGNLNFDSKMFEYCTTVIEDVSADRHDNIVNAVTGESISLEMTSYSVNANAKFYFKNITDELDFTGFAFDVESITRTNKETASATSTESVKYDYTGDDGVQDKLIDVRDLVRAAKDNKAPVDVRKAMVGIHDDSDWVTGVTGETKADVYVDAVNGSYIGDGTEESPLSSLLLASYQVASDGTIHVVGDYTFSDKEFMIGMGEKSITITGNDGVLDLTAVSTLEVCGDVILKNITVKADNDEVYANGHNLTIESTVTFDGYVGKIFGGNLGEMPLQETNLNLQAGNYNIIYGGSKSVSTIAGDTHVTIGGTVNNSHPDFDVTDHKYNEIVCAYAGSHNGLVKGNTNVTVEDSAKTSYVHGGGWGANSEVRGMCNVYANGGTLSGIYGGSLGGTVYNTNVVITGGTMEQVFGGSWVGSLSDVDAKITGETNVTFTGGTVSRRIFGGCYNNSSSDGNIVTGTSTLNIGVDANYTHNYGGGWYDYVLCAGSRYSTSSDAENSVLNITTAKNSSYSSYIDKSGYGSSETVNVVDELP